MDVKMSPSAKNPNVTVVSLSGRLDTQTAATASGQIMEALDRSGAGMILDLHAMEFISSAGLSILLALRQKAEPGGKKIAIIRAHPSVYKIFKITALDQVLNFFDDEDEAIQMLWPAT
jgi:anti-sigma B factor antagonist